MLEGVNDGPFFVGAQFLALSVAVTAFLVYRYVRLKMGYHPPLMFLKHHLNVFRTAATQLGLSETSDNRDERNARIPAIRRLRPSFMQSSQVRSRYTGEIGGLPIEVLDWSNNVVPMAHQETIVILPFHGMVDRETFEGSLIAGQPLASRPKHRPIDHFDDDLGGLNGLYSASDGEVLELIGPGNLPVLLSAAKSTAPFEIRFQPGEMVFAQSLISLRDDAKEHEMGVMLHELTSEHRVARDSEFVIDTVKRAITLHSALSMASD